MPKKRRRRWRTLRGLLTGMVAGLVAFVLLLGGALVGGGYAYYQLSGLIVPGVRLGNVELGNLTLTEAERKLDRRWVSSQSVFLTDGERWWSTSPEALGITFNARATAHRAHDVGRGQDVPGEILALVDSTLHGTAVEPVVAVDIVAAREWLEAWSETIDRPAQDATIDIVGGKVVAVPGEPGKALDVERTLQPLIADPGAALADNTLNVEMVTVAPRNLDASAALAEAERLLDDDLAIQAYDPITDEHVQWTASREQIASWLTVTDETSIAIDEERLEDYLGELSDQLGQGRHLDAEQSLETVADALHDDAPAAGLIVKHATTLYTVQPGDSLIGIAWELGFPSWHILEANPGLSANSLSVGQVLNIPSKDVLLPLPVVIEKRIVVSIDQQRLWAYEDGELVYEYVISTGIDRSPTQPGIFQVQTHEPSAYAGLWDLTMPNFLGIYEAWPGFMNGFHGLPTLSNGQILWADVLGKPASYGCIILDLDDAETLYQWAEEGVVVEIVA